MICERCGKEHDGSFGSGRFCSKACANKRAHSDEWKEKVRESLKQTYNRIEAEGRQCEKCGNIFHSKDMSRKLCFDCLPTTIKHTKGKENPKTLLEVSKRTVSKILRRMNLPCSCCGFHISGVVLDIHHINPKAKGGTDDMSNLTYICPNCHRIAHTDTQLLNKPLVSIEEQLKSCGKNWLDFYFGV